MELFCFREGNALVPADAESSAVLAKFRMGKIVKVEAKQSRSGPRHRLYWAMVQRIANAIGAEPENVSDVLKVETGHYSLVKTKDAEYKFPRSISYSKMTDPEHRDFFERCIQVIYEKWSIPRPDILRELSDLLTPTEVRG